MTDEPPPGQPQEDHPADGGAGLLSAEELDKVLSQASMLATDLSDELGDGEDSDRIPLDGPADVDAELNEMELLAAAASRELDDNVRAANGPSTETNTTARPEEPLAVPDFLSEFTDPPQTPAPKLAANTNAFPPQSQPTTKNPAETAAPRPGVIGPGMIGVLGTPSKESAKQPDPPAETTEEGQETPRSIFVKSLGALKSKGAQVGPAACALGLHAVRILEIIDAPIAGMNDATRRWIGWVAIATLGTAAIVYTISVF